MRTVSYEAVPADELIVRDWLAYDRTRLAVERTALAYVRTVLALIGFGVALLQFKSDSRVALLAGAVLLGGGGVLGLVGVFQTMRASGRLRPFHGADLTS